MGASLEFIAEPRRQEILRLVWHEERTAGEIASHFDITFGAVSQHLGRLREAGLVTQRREGRRQWYRAEHAAFGPLAAALEAMWFGKLTTLKTMAEAEQRRINGARKGTRSGAAR